MEYKEVKIQSEEMLKQIISYINKTDLSSDECDHLIIELAASLTICACIGGNLDISEKLFCKNLSWLISSTAEAVTGYFKGNGNVDYEIIE